MTHSPPRLVCSASQRCPLPFIGGGVGVSSPSASKPPFSVNFIFCSVPCGAYTEKEEVVPFSGSLRLFCISLRFPAVFNAVNFPIRWSPFLSFTSVVSISRGGEWLDDLTVTHRSSVCLRSRLFRREGSFSISVWLRSYVPNESVLMTTTDSPLPISTTTAVALAIIIINYI